MLRQPDPPRRHYGGKIADPDRWADFDPRVGDIVVSTPPESGTTWMQGILALLLSGDPEVDAAISRDAPWIDMTTPEQDGIGAVAGQASPRTAGQAAKVGNADKADVLEFRGQFFSSLAA